MSDRRAPRKATFSEAFAGYEGFLLDAYGVLVDGAGVLPQAAEIFAAIAGRPFRIVTNDASKLPETAAQSWARLGLVISAEHIITSGALLVPYFREHRLVGARTFVLGPEDSHTYAACAGGYLVDGSDGFDVLVVGDESGFTFLPAVDRALTGICDAIDEGRSIRMVVPNPDLIYPKGGGRFGVAAGAIAVMLERAVRARHPQWSAGFDILGKPSAPIFEEGRAQLGNLRIAMVGDQLMTDIHGARRVGMDAILITSGVAHWTEEQPEPWPTFVV